MTKEEIIYVKLTPCEGMLLTDGNDITSSVCAPKGKEDVWYEIEKPKNYGLPESDLDIDKSDDLKDSDE